MFFTNFLKSVSRTVNQKDDWMLWNVFFVNFRESIALKKNSTNS